MIKRVAELDGPFAIMKHGLEGYEGEYSMWNTKDITFLHIFVRILGELERAQDWNFEFYPYLLTTEHVHTLDALKTLEKPIPIYFTPVKKEIDSWPEQVPDSKKISWDCDNASRHTKLLHETIGTIEIPCPIRIGDGSSYEYYALLISDLIFYTSDRRISLDFSNSSCVHISQGTPISASLSGSLTFGVYEDCKDDSKSSGNYQIEVVAQALLQPPYYATVKQ